MPNCLSPAYLVPKNVRNPRLLEVVLRKSRVRRHVNALDCDERRKPLAEYGTMTTENTALFRSSPSLRNISFTSYTVSFSSWIWSLARNRLL